MAYVPVCFPESMWVFQLVKPIAFHGPQGHTIRPFSTTLGFLPSQWLGNSQSIVICSRLAKRAFSACFWANISPAEGIRPDPTSATYALPVIRLKSRGFCERSIQCDEEAMTDSTEPFARNARACVLPLPSLVAIEIHSSPLPLHFLFYKPELYVHYS